MPILALLALAALSPRVAPTRDYCFRVNVIGKGKPVILIPGLTCTGQVWDGTVAHLKGHYRCYVLTLPGFGKQTPIEGPYLSHVRDDILAYVKAEKLDHPSLIGHSLGGFMTFSLGVAEPNLWGKLVAVDGLPFLSVVSNPKATSESMRPYADAIAKQLIDAPPERFRAGIKAILATQITDPKIVESVNETCQDSNQANVAEAMKELLTTDLRDKVSAIHSPLLLIGAGQQATTDDAKKSLKEVYASAIRTIPHSTLEMDWNARHFVMLDDPTFFYQCLDDFLSSHP